MQKNGKLESLVSQRVCGDGVHPPAPDCRANWRGGQQPPPKGHCWRYSPSSLIPTDLSKDKGRVNSNIRQGPGTVAAANLLFGDPPTTIWTDLCENLLELQGSIP